MKTRTLTLILGLALWALPAAAEPPRVLYDDVSNQHFPKSVPATSSDSNTGQDTSGNDNRSGLGDGTNPGQGADHNADKNSGTLNPGGLKKL